MLPHGCPILTGHGHLGEGQILGIHFNANMFNGGFPSVQIYDITDPRDVVLIPAPDPTDSGIEGDGPLHLRGFFRYVPRLDTYYFIQSFAPPYIGILENKYLDPERVRRSVTGRT